MTRPQYYYGFDLACAYNLTDPASFNCGAAANSCPDPADGLFFVFRGLDPNELQRVGNATVCLGPGDTTSVTDIAAALPETARRMLGQNIPVVTVEPAGATLVNYPAVFSATLPGPSQPTSATAAITGASVTVTLTPTYTWTFGDGAASVSTLDAQRAYDGTLPSAAPAGYYLTHVYDRTGARTVTVSVSWLPSYEIAGVAGAFTSDPIVFGAETAVLVREARSRLVG